MNAITITDATPEDAPLIGWAIMEAVGDEIVSHLAAGHSREDVHRLFSTLALRPDSQYYYKNTRVATFPDGTRVGLCISYDGGRILELRKSFFQEAEKILGWSVSPAELDRLPGETNGDEFYLDTLATLPAYRGRGIARALIEDARCRSEEAGLPLGLLVADDNPGARSLYEAVGFRPVGRRWFAGEEMTNMRMV